MANTLVVKKRFHTKVLQVLEYLKTEWSSKDADNFSIILEKRLEHLLITPYAGAPTGLKDVRSILITKQNRIYYKVSDLKVIVLNMYDTRINPKKNPYKK